MRVETKLTFWMQINIKVSYKLISTLWTSKISTRWYYQYCWAWSSILKMLKATRSSSFLLAGKHQNFCKLVLSFLMKVARHIQSTQNSKLVNVLQYIKKKVLQLILCSILMQNIQILYGVPVVFIVTCFWVVVVKMHVVF